MYKNRQHPTEAECRLFCCPILPSSCRFCSFLKLLSYRHTAKAVFLFALRRSSTGKREREWSGEGGRSGVLREGQRRDEAAFAGAEDIARDDLAATDVEVGLTDLARGMVFHRVGAALDRFAAAGLQIKALRALEHIVAQIGLLQLLGQGERERFDRLRLDLPAEGVQVGDALLVRCGGSGTVRAA